MDTDPLLIYNEERDSTYTVLSDGGQDECRQRTSKKSRGIFKHPETAPMKHIPKKYAYMFRQKSFWELVLISGTVCGLEFCYSAETALVTPILLSLGLNMRFVTMIWCLSPLIGLFVTPILGSWSDNCRSRLGRRRPFILMYSCGIILGLILVPNGHSIGKALGDFSNLTSDSHSMTLGLSGTMYRRGSLIGNLRLHNINHNTSNSSSDVPTDAPTSYIQTWSIVFTAIGTIFLDFCCDACQSPSRTLVLDISHPEDHAAGLSTFALMAGLGGSLGYVIGAVDWEQTISAVLMMSQVTIVFSLVGIVFVVCLLSTIFSFPEMPLTLLDDEKVNREFQSKMQASIVGTNSENETVPHARYGAVEQIKPENVPDGKLIESLFLSPIKEDLLINEMDNDSNHQITLAKELASPQEQQHLSFTGYLKSIVLMPTSLKILCLTDLFCWMSLLCYSLYFTDFVAEVVFRGDPLAPEGSVEFKQYAEGVRFGCWGMAISSLSCAVYSLFLEYLVKKIGSKKTYIGGQLVYFFGMILMAIVSDRVAVVILSATTGVMYATLFTMPYILIADYHSKNQFSSAAGSGAVRGMGTDVATVSSMVFVAQIVLSLSMGAVVEAVGSSVVIVWAAVALSGCGALSATQVLYLN